mgnify:CR=1 FL=1
MPKKDKKDKKKWKLKNVKAQTWKDAGESLSGTGKKLADTESEERSKTQSLKDKLYIKRSGRG